MIVDDWNLTYGDYDPYQESLREALCTVGNGYFATRGAAPEHLANDVHYPGTCIAGCYNRLTTRIAGEAVEIESLINAPNWLLLTFRIDDGEWFDLSDVKVLDYHQEFDLRNAVLTRDVRFRDHAGRHTRVRQRRLASMDQFHVAALETRIYAEDWNATLELKSALDGRVTNSGVARYQALDHQHLEALNARPTGTDSVLLEMQTNQNQSLTIEKIAAIFTSRDNAITDPALEAEQAVAHAGRFDVEHTDSSGEVREFHF